MAFEFQFPDVGEGIHEGEIVRWRVKVGDEIKEDQPVVEIETAKAVVEIPSPKSGTILATVGKEGEVIKVGATLIVIGEKGEEWKPKSIQQSRAEPADEGTQNTAGQASQASPGVVGQIPTEEKGVVLPSRTISNNAQNASGGGTILPRTRKMAQDAGVDLSKVKGTGANGQITEQDIQNAAAANAGPPPESFGVVERMPVKGIRKVVAENMTKSIFTIPHVTHMDECDVTALVKLRESKKPEAEKMGIKLTYLPFIIKAVVEALKKFPGLNAEYRERTGAGAQAGSEGQPEIIYKKYYNIGIAVDTPDGLMVPVIKGADKKDIFALAKEIVELAEKCRTRKIAMEDLQGGSFNITNIGSVGGVFATPVIAYGQSGVLATMRMKEKPVVIEGKIEIRPILSLAISFDHRVVDGADAARFLNEIMMGLSPQKS